MGKKDGVYYHLVGGVILFPLQIKQALFSFHLKDKFFLPTDFSSQKGYQSLSQPVKVSNEQSKGQVKVKEKKGVLSRKALLLSFLALLPSVIAKELRVLVSFRLAIVGQQYRYVSIVPVVAIFIHNFMVLCISSSFLSLLQLPGNWTSSLSRLFNTRRISNTQKQIKEGSNSHCLLIRLDSVRSCLTAKLPRKEKPSKGLSPYNLGPPKSSSVVSTHPKDPKPVNHAILTFQPIGQSRYPYLSTNPFDSDSAAVYNLGSLTLMSTAPFLFQ